MSFPPLLSLKSALIRHGDHLRPLCSYFHTVWRFVPREAIRLPAPLLSASFPLYPCPALSIDKSLLRDYKPVITDGYVVTTARDAIAGAFAWEKWLI